MRKHNGDEPTHGTETGPEPQQFPEYPEPQAHPEEPAAVAMAAPEPPTNPEPAEPLPAASSQPEPVRVVTGIHVRTVGHHEHEGIRYPPGAGLVLPCELASALIRSGAVDFVSKEENQT